MSDQPEYKPEEPQVRMSFGEHLEELRWRLIKVLIGAAVGLVVCFIFERQIMLWLMRPLSVALASQGESPKLVTLQPAETFIVVLKMCFICGLILSAPYGLWQVWAFVAAGLYRHERSFVQRMAPASIVLFALGVLFLFYVVLPVVLSFLISIGSWVPPPGSDPGLIAGYLVPEQPPATQPAASQPGVALPILEHDPPDPQVGQFWVNTSDNQLKIRLDGQTRQADLRRASDSFVRPNFALSFYFSFVTHLALGFGIGFQVPIVVVFLAVLNIVPVEQMARARRYVAFGMVVASALVTPPDVTSQVMLAGPMILLYEIGLVTARVMIRRRAAGES